MVENLRLVSAQTVAKVLKYDVLIPAIEKALGNFSNRPESGVIQPLRTVLRLPAADGFLGVMPAYSETDGALSTKLLTFFPHNTAPLPTHHAVVVLFDCRTGIPTAILDGDVITAMRTAAASAVATKHLVSGTPHHLAILGAGVQARSHFHALSHLYNFHKVTVWNHRPEKAQSLAQELGPHVIPFTDARQAVKDADVIVTVTCSSTPILMADWVKAGTHINAIGSCRPDWQEIDPQLMQTAAIYVDSREAALKESGDIIKSGATIIGELGEVISGTVEAKRNETTVFKSLGIAVEDAVAASLVTYALTLQDAAEGID